MKSEMCVNSRPSTSNYADLEMMCNYRRLKHIRRFNNFPTIQTEDVAQHSYYTTILAMTMAEEYNAAVAKHNQEIHLYDLDNVWEKVNVSVVMKKALFHDIEEAFVSDIPWNVKHHNSAVNAILTGVAQSKLQDIYKSCSPIFQSHMHTKLNSKSGLEGAFVAIADMMECAWCCYQEAALGNTYLEFLQKKAIQIIQSHIFAERLSETSPLFNAMMDLLTGVKKAQDYDVMSLD